MQGTTIGSHHLGHVAAGHLGPCKQLESTHYRVVFHGTALHHDALSEAVVAM